MAVDLAEKTMEEFISNLAPELERAAVTELVSV